MEKDFDGRGVSNAKPLSVEFDSSLEELSELNNKEVTIAIPLALYSPSLAKDCSFIASLILEKCAQKAEQAEPDGALEKGKQYVQWS